MILQIVRYGDPVLRQKGAPVTNHADPTIQNLAADMLDTMRAADGVGLAAQQVGKALQMCVIDVADIEDRPSTMSVNGAEVDMKDWMPLVLINPTVDLGKEKESGTEGCLSFPEVTAEIVRSETVVCHATLGDGRPLTFEATGLLARAVQHEVDHLNGVLFIDRMNSATKATLAGRLKRMQRGGR